MKLFLLSCEQNIYLIWNSSQSKGEELKSRVTSTVNLTFFNLSYSFENLFDIWLNRLSAKSLLWKSLFIYIEIGTNCHNKNFALRLALKERLRGTRKWLIAEYPPPFICIRIPLLPSDSIRECRQGETMRPGILQLFHFVLNLSNYLCYTTNGSYVPLKKPRTWLLFRDLFLLPWHCNRTTAKCKILDVFFQLFFFP